MQNTRIIKKREKYVRPAHTPHIKEESNVDALSIFEESNIARTNQYSKRSNIARTNQYSQSSNIHARINIRTEATSHARINIRTNVGWHLAPRLLAKLAYGSQPNHPLMVHSSLRSLARLPARSFRASSTLPPLNGGASRPPSLGAGGNNSPPAVWVVLWFCSFGQTSLCDLRPIVLLRFLLTLFDCFPQEASRPLTVRMTSSSSFVTNGVTFYSPLRVSSRPAAMAGRNARR